MRTKSTSLALAIFMLGLIGGAKGQATKVAPTAQAEQNLPTPQVLIFDVNETLLDLAPLRASVGKALDGREDLLPLWFVTMLHYSLVETLSGEYHSFGEIGTAALMMVAETKGIELTYDEAKEAIVTPLRSLPPHPDVVAGLKALKDDGYRIVSLTNSSAIGVETQFRNAGLIDLFEKRYSVDSVKKFKPHPETYRFVLDDLGVQPEQVLMVAAHAWDLAGAKNVGLQTAFVARPGKTLYPNVAKPDYVVNDLLALETVLKRSKSRNSAGRERKPIPSTLSGETSMLSQLLEERAAANAARYPEKVSQAYALGIETVRATDIEKSAKQVGDAAIDAHLTGWDGERVKLSELWRDGPIVLMWYRGGWCPYCNLQLRAMQQSMDQIENAGAKLVVLTPELPEKAKETAEANDLEIVALHDKDNEVARKYGLVFQLPEPIIPAYRDKRKLPEYNGNDSMELPLSATYVIDTAGKITFAFLDADYKRRAEPADVIEAVKAAAR
ncbi:haloacid dehalogenase type II [Aureliella helgolandensis]|uniref:Haloacetate dehalogenase H-2 n=1 Tax=Aureliella helgolandensis TaxID=2527968 RepID=A0A518GAX6_9BACT|nr:haloacid dehalogenase type II [Aureliella helgolandensis]QDV25758.1 Haloacetate dehalogenase H-2 [Aureliella helgolandensis]